MIGRDVARSFLADYLAAHPRRFAAGDEVFDKIVVYLATRDPTVEDRTSFLYWLERHQFYNVEEQST